MSISGRMSQLAAIAVMLAAGEDISEIKSENRVSNTTNGHPSGLGNASLEEVAKIREETKRRKELNFRKRLPKGHPDRIES